MKITQSMAKRIMAMMLVLSMMLTTLGGYAPCGLCDTSVMVCAL